VALAALLAALSARDGYTGEHSDVVVGLAEAVAEELGVEGRRISEIKQVALLHDIGKIGIPDEILHKPRPLNEEEWIVMKTHPETGARIVSGISNLVHLAEAVRAEHERWDGGGYPDGLAGEDVPLASRIVLACDAWHAMTSDRPYRRSLGEDEALRRLRDASGTQFDPEVVDALIRVLRAGTEHVDPVAGRAAEARTRLSA